MVTMQGPTGSATGQEVPRLPAEIIFYICHYFTVDPHNPAKSFNVSPDTRDNIRTLRQLSLTCRSIHAEVTPALYCSIYFTCPPMIDPDFPLATHCQDPGAESLVYFLRTILGNAELRRYVKHLACLIDLRDRCKDVRTTRLLERAGLWIDPSSTSQLGFGNAFGTACRRPFISMTHQTFALIACLLPNVTSITLKTGSRLPCYPRSADLYYIKAKDMTGRPRCNMTQHNPLQSLTVLQVQCEHESTVMEANDQTIGLLEWMPLLRNASNLRQVRCYGSDPSWRHLPDTMAAFECWGPVSTEPVYFRGGDSILMHLKVMAIHLDCAAKALNFSLDYLCFILSLVAPKLEHLKVLLSPGTCIKPDVETINFSVDNFTRLQYLCFDTRLVSDIFWDKHLWQDLESGWSVRLRGIETLRIVDSEPRANLDSILRWLQAIMHNLFQSDYESTLKKFEYFHMSSLADVNHNSSNWSVSNLTNEMRQELALYGVEFQLSLVHGEGGEFLGAEFPE
jgi:hypothetical protein